MLKETSVCQKRPTCVKRERDVAVCARYDTIAGDLVNLVRHTRPKRSLCVKKRLI